MTSEDHYNRFPTESDDMFNEMVERNYINDNNIDTRFMSESDDLDLSRWRTHNNIPEPKNKKNTSFNLSGTLHKPVKSYKSVKCDLSESNEDVKKCKYHK